MSFYAQQLVTSPNSPLHLIWLASHQPPVRAGGGGGGGGRALSRADVVKTSVRKKVDEIRALVERSSLALRLSGQLLLGATHIHASQV